MEDNKMISNYKILSEIGKGGLCTVYKAYDIVKGRTIALKLLELDISEDSEYSIRFEREFQAVSKLKHPNIVAVYEHGIFEKKRFFTMEYVEGKQLLSYFGIEKNKKLPQVTQLNQSERIEKVVNIFDQICSALSYIHENKIVHRDLKPDNILVTKEGIAKIMDFGVLRKTDVTAELTKTGAILGTASYISPEQALGKEIDYRSDLYSLGVMLYEVLTGRKPFETDKLISLLLKHVNEEPTPLVTYNPLVNSVLEEITLKLLKKNPIERYQTAKEVQKELKRVLEDSSSYRETQISLRKIPHFIVSCEKTKSSLFEPSFTGRKEELKILKDNLNNLINGHGNFIVIGGDIGSGKTRLIQEFIGEVKKYNIPFYFGKCFEDDTKPYRAFIDIINLALKDKIEPEFFKKITFPKSDEEKNSFFSTITDILKEKAKQKPILFFIDDLHLCDPLSQELLTHIIRNIIYIDKVMGRKKGKSPILIVATYSYEWLDKNNLKKYLNSLKRGDLVDIIPLKNLRAKEVEEMVQSMFGLDEIPENLIDKIYKESEGNPKIIVEILKYLVEEGALYKKNAKWILESELAKHLTKEENYFEELEISYFKTPPRIKNDVQRNFESLPDDYKSVLNCAAVIGKEFEFSILLRICDKEEDELLDIIDNLLRSRIIKEDTSYEDRFSFSHKKVRDILYEEIIYLKRKKLHKKIAQIMEEIYSNHIDEYIERIAWHYYKAEEHEKTFNFAIKAGDVLKKNYLYESSISYYNLALEMTKFIEDKKYDLIKLDLFKKIGSINEIIQNYEEAINFYTKRRKLASFISERAGEADSLNRLSMIYCKISHFDKGLELAKDALLIGEEIGDKTLCSKIRGNMGIIIKKIGDLQKGEKYIQEACSALEKVDEPNYLFYLNELSELYRMKGDFNKALKFSDKSYKLAMKIQDRELIIRARLEMANSLIFEDIHKSISLSKDSLYEATSFHFKELILQSHITLSNLYLILKDYDNAIQESLKSIELMNITPYVSNLEPYLILGNIYKILGNFDYAFDYYNKGIKLIKGMLEHIDKNYHKYFKAKPEIKEMYQGIKEIMGNLG